MIWVVVILGLQVLVFVHELGHYTVARLLGIRPRSFYVGFPPAVVKVRRKGIEYGLGAIPVGGFVRIPGMHRPAGRDVDAYMTPALREQPELAPSVQRVRRALDVEDFAGAAAALPELREQVEAATLSASARRSAKRTLRDTEEATGADAYWRQPTWKRIAVIAAGPFANILAAFAIFLGVYATGAPSSTASTGVAAIESGTPAAAAGLRPGDRVVAVDGRTARTFDAVSRLIRASHGSAITVTVDRNGGRVTLGPAKTIYQGGHWIWGFQPAERLVAHPIGASARLAAGDCWQVVAGTGQALASLVGVHEQGQVMGTVGIVRVSAAALKVSFAWYLQIVALVSMSLALLNLLPLLPLDGGHILFSVVEAVRRRALAREVYERVSVVGFAVILLIWFIALSNDFRGAGPH